VKMRSREHLCGEDSCGEDSCGEDSSCLPFMDLPYVSSGLAIKILEYLYIVAWTLFSIMKLSKIDTFCILMFLVCLAVNASVRNTSVYIQVKARIYEKAI
jgi:hypothetical protein